MKRNLLIVFLTSLFSLQGDTCTSFSLGESTLEQVFGKSFDWNEHHALLMINKRNMRKKALSVNPFERGATWTSQFGSITFNQHGRDFPLGGMNEKGLIVEIMLGTAEHPGFFDPRPVVNEVQWIQYVLDNYESVADMLASIDQIRIQKVTTSVHYLVCDAFKECATVEFIGGELVVHSGNNLVSDVFANSTYQSSLQSLEQHEGYGGNKPIPNDSSSLSRFVRATHLVDEYEFNSFINPVDYSFDVIDQVALNGAWRIVYSKDKISYKTVSNRKIREVSFLGKNFDCRTPVLTLNIHQDFEGSAENYWGQYNEAQHRELVEQNARVPNSLKEMIISYPNTHTSCLN